MIPQLMVKESPSADRECITELNNTFKQKYDGNGYLCLYL